MIVLWKKTPPYHINFSLILYFKRICYLCNSPSYTHSIYLYPLVMHHLKEFYIKGLPSLYLYSLVCLLWDIPLSIFYSDKIFIPTSYYPTICYPDFFLKNKFPMVSVGLPEIFYFPFLWYTKKSITSIVGSVYLPLIHCCKE